VTTSEIGYRWAPVHFQDADETDCDADYVAAVDYDSGA
jgi:hypothetical protein